MRTSVQVIRALLGDPQFADFEHQSERDQGAFEFYRLNLRGPRYRGFLPEWGVAVLRGSDNPRSNLEVQAVYEAARRLTSQGRSPSTHLVRMPLVLASDDPRVKLADTLPSARHIFLVDHSGIPALRPDSGDPITSPLVKAVRNTLTRPEVTGLMFSPYIRNRPVEGWRFFGRRKELGILVDSNESFFVVGGRRIGKTSLLRETARRLEEAGASVIFVDVEACESEADVVRKVLQSISPKEAEAAVRRQRALLEPMISAALKRIAASSASAVLILDELGNVIARLPTEQWRILGTLREFAHSSRVRVIISCFQELFQKQAIDGRGPLVNFGTVLRLHALTTADIEEMLIAPLTHWSRIANTKSLMQLALTSIGRHPYVLQTFCHELFQRVIKQPEREVLSIARSIVESDREYTACFREAVDELYTRALTPLLRFLYLKRCHEAEMGNVPIAEAAVDDDWLIRTLEECGYTSSLDDRTALLEGLEMRGLTDQRDDRRVQFTIVTPMIYHYFKKAGADFPALFRKYQIEILEEHERWGLRKR